MVGPERIELSLPREPDFESGASTSSATTPSVMECKYYIYFNPSTLFLFILIIFNHFYFYFTQNHVILSRSLIIQRLHWKI